MTEEIAHQTVYSHINQQIALKTIKKLHFSVNAVWNGQEALEYLAKEFGPLHPRPDIILMDVQASKPCRAALARQLTNDCRCPFEMATLPRMLFGQKLLGATCPKFRVFLLLP